MSNLEYNLEKLNQIKALTFGWNDNNAPPIDKFIINAAERFLYEVEYQPEIFPLATNGIQIEYEFDNGSYLEFDFEKDKIHEWILLYGKYSMSKEADYMYENLDIILNEVKCFYLYYN